MLEENGECFYLGKRCIINNAVFKNRREELTIKMPTTIKQALKKWEEATQRKAAESKEIKLIGVSPPIEKMEGPFHLLVNLEKFSLSTNMISSITNLQSFKNLKVLSLGRNVLKSLQGIEAAADTLEQLWISYNQIDKLKPLRNMLKLKVLYMAHNFVREWREFEHMAELPVLEDLVFIGNPLEEDVSPTGNDAHRFSFQ